MLTLDDWKVTPEKIDAVVKRIVEVAHPSKVIVFGSAARAEEAPRDLDVLVVLKEEPVSPRRESVRIMDEMNDIIVPLDLLVISETRLAHERKLRASVYAEAIRTGKVVYDAAA